MNEVRLTIDGKEIVAQAGDSILKAATDNGIEIPTLCYHEKVAVYGACGLCVVEAEKCPKLLRACSAKVAEGMVVHTRTPRVLRARTIALELLMSDHEGDCRGPCVLHCPANIDCQKYVKQIGEGKYQEAVKTIKQKNPLPSSIGRVCPHPCEKACRRQMVEEPISIAFLKSFAGDRDLASETPYQPPVAAETGKSVAVIGGGPGGLTAAYFLRQKGHKVTILDAMPEMGGMLRYGIPAYRLPKDVLAREIDLISDLGVTMENNVKVGVDVTLDQLKQQYDAVVVAIGAWTSSSMRCPGEDLQGVMGGIGFLGEIAQGQKPAIGDRVMIVGGGNTAMDACRSAVRLGAKEVCLVYRRTRDEMPAEEIEIIEAEEEGVAFKLLRNPAEILGENGHVTAVKLQVMELGEPDASGRRAPVPVEGKFETVPVDTVIAAIGQKVCVKGFEELELNKKGIIAADEKTFRTSVDGVFAIGDATNKGASIAISAIDEGYRAAVAVDGYLLGLELAYRSSFYSETKVRPEKFADREKIARAQMPHMSAQERKNTFREMNYGFSEEQARAEAKRCLECGCHDYDECRLIHFASQYDIDPQRLAGAKNNALPVNEELVSIEFNRAKCILCGLCVRTCHEVAHKGILGLVGRGFGTQVKPEFNKPEVLAFCKDCHACVDACPTGATKLVIK